MPAYPLENNFKYHPLQEGQPQRYEELREMGKRLATTIVDLCPESREKSLALTNLEQAIFWASASIARNEKSEDSLADPSGGVA